jgi:hypothetical protein
MNATTILSRMIEDAPQEQCPIKRLISSMRAKGDFFEQHLAGCLEHGSQRDRERLLAAFPEIQVKFR